jgi:hypothetical protein
MRYEAEDIKDADDQNCERWIEQDFHFVHLLCVAKRSFYPSSSYSGFETEAEQ